MFLRMTDSSIVAELQRMGCSSERIEEVERNRQNKSVKISGLSKKVASSVAKVAREIGLEYILNNVEPAEVSDLLLLGSLMKYRELLSQLEKNCSNDICKFCEN